MSLQKMISDIETERGHNQVMGQTFKEQLNALKLRHSEEIDALVDAFMVEVDARDKALSAMVNGHAR